MTNKEKYKQAFSALHPPGDISVEVERMAIMSRKAKFRTAAATAARTTLPTGGTQRPASPYNPPEISCSSAKMYGSYSLLY